MTIEPGMIVIVIDVDNDYYINRLGEVVSILDEKCFVIWFQKNGERGTRKQEWIDKSLLVEQVFT